MPGGAQYLPPIVSKLLGDASDLLAAFAEAKAAQEAFTKSQTQMSEKVKASSRSSSREVDDFTNLVVRKMHASESAAAVLKRRLREVGDEVALLRKRVASEGANQGLTADFRRANDELKKLRNLARELAPDLLNGGRQGGRGLVAGILSAFSGFGELLMPILVGAVILASPAIASTIGAAVLVGLGLGFIGLGTFLAAMFFPKIKAQFIAAGREFKNALVYAISGGFLPAVRSAMLIFRQYIPFIGKDLRRIFDALAPAVRPLADALGAGLDTFLSHIADALPQMMPSLLEFIATIPLVMQAVADFLVTITKNGPALSRFIVDAAYAISGFLNSTAQVIAWLEGVYLWAVKINDVFPFIGWQRDWGKVKISLLGIGAWFKGLWDKIVQGVKDVGHWFADLGRGIWDWAKGVGRAVGDFVTGVIDWFQALPGKIIRFIASIPGKVVGFVSSMAHRVAYLIGWMIGTWLRLMLTLPGKVLGIIISVWAWTQTKTKQGVDWVIAEVKALPGQVGRFFAMMWSAVTSWVAKTWASAVLWFARTKQSIIEHVASAITAAIAFFKGLPGRTAEQLAKFKDRVLKFFGDARKWLIEAGKDIVRGIVDGVSGMWNWAVDKVKGFAHDILKGFKDAIGSHSPAKAFITEGRNSALGYIQGWAQTIGKVRDAVSGRQTLQTVLTYPTGGNPRTPPPPPPGDPRGGGMTQAVFYLDGKRFASAVTAPVQRRAGRNGITGVGAPTTRIM
jgi:hypothetical protein